MVISSEIEDIKKRLTALGKQNLRIAQVFGQMLCTMVYNVNMRLFRGEELGSYTKLWKKRLDDATEEIYTSPTVERAIELSHSFFSELVDYVRATKVDTADKAMEIAHSFIKKYSPVALPLKAVKEGDVWLVDVDVGALAVKIAKVKIDARTGDILSYEIPQRGNEKS